MEKYSVAYLKNKAKDFVEEKGLSLSAQVNMESAVLLENNGILPIKPCKVALYGLGARKTIVRGIGSGDISYRYTVNIEQGLENAGFTITNKEWLDEFDKEYEKYWSELLVDIEKEKNETGVDNLHVYYNRPHIIPAYGTIDSDAIGKGLTDTAIFVLSRKEGEGTDRRYAEGEYLLAKEELKQLRQIREKYEKFILLLNIGAPIDMRDILKIAPDAILLIFQGGAELGNAAAALLTGKENPSGKLTSTWAKDYWDYPNSKEFGINDNDINSECYREGIYIGYRYFSTFNVEPEYPFGYGKSYTTFGLEYITTKCERNSVIVKLVVTNTGKYKGKEVVQLYVSLPGETIDQAKLQLCEYEKTRDLEPGEAQLIKLRFNFEDLASYRKDDGAYVLEKGKYVLYLGRDVSNVKPCSAVTLEREIITRKVKHLFERPIKFDVLAPTPVTQAKTGDEGLEVVSIDAAAIPVCGNVEYLAGHDNYFGGKIDPETVNRGDGKDIYIDVPEKISLSQVLNGEYTVEQFVASMDEEELVHLVVGQEYIDAKYLIKSVSPHVLGACGETTNYFEENNKWRKIPYAIIADGPAGLRLIQRVQADKEGNFIFINPLMAYEDGQFVKENVYTEENDDYYQFATGFPIAIAQASTWNKNLLRQVGRHVGLEMQKFNIDLWLAPGMNLHRNPLGGRCFEYYSEDPYLSAMTAVALVNGVQENEGRGATVKHMAASNQEAGRTSHNSIVDERTMRDLYLKNFELVIKYAKPHAVMTCLNCVNGPHGTNSIDIAMHVLREEWKYTGLVITDWNTTTPERGASTVGCINSGNDLIMPGMEADLAKLRYALHNNSGRGETIALGNLQFCVKNVINYLLKIKK